VRKTFLTFRGRTLALLLAAIAMRPCGVAWADEPLAVVSAVNVTDFLGDLHGGFARGTGILDKADLTATYLGDDHHHPGLSLFLDVQATGGTRFTDILVGDAQGVSNLEAPAGLRLANAWAAKDFDGLGGIKAGVVDLNTEFDVQATALLFLNAAFGVGPDFAQSGPNGPSIFPSTGLGLVGWWLPGGHWTLKAGLFEGAPGDAAHPGRTRFSYSEDEGALLVFEARNHLKPDFVIGAGSWRYTASFDAIDPSAGRIAGNAGFYAIADSFLYAASEDEKLSGWARIGFADDRINVLDSAIGFGLVYAGPLGRQADQAGISVARARFGVPAQKAALAEGVFLGAAETTIEATYSLSLNSHLTIQPDFQYVIAPGGYPLLEDAIVIGSRLTLTP
jgi:porin